MGTVIGEFLPLAVGVAISPIPIVAAILMLLSKNAGSTGSGFGLGWVVGIFAATGIVALLSGGLDTSDSGGSSGSVSWIKVALGVLLVVLAGSQWRARGDASVPKWMQALDWLNFPKAAGLGVALSAINPKNLLLCASAGLVIGTGGLGTGEAVGALVVFTVIAASSVLIPVLGYAVAAQRLRGPLDTLSQWLRANNHQVMAIVLVIMGAAVIGKGLGGL